MTWGLIFAECHINYRSPFQVLFSMRVADRVAAEGYGWLVGFDYEAERSCPLPDSFREVLQNAP